ncbi:hypothetical protein NL676_021510 [Syzygium grande]|nr:hypothetical protein NL676_021510 [Syzygium grande]
MSIRDGESETERREQSVQDGDDVNEMWERVGVRFHEPFGVQVRGVYRGDVRLWELDASRDDPQLQTSGSPTTRFGSTVSRPISKRCPPADPPTVSSFSVRCKLESSSPIEQANLINLHASCFYEFKISSGDNESERVFLCWCLGEDSRSVTIDCARVRGGY